MKDTVFLKIKKINKKRPGTNSGSNKLITNTFFFTNNFYKNLTFYSNSFPSNLSLV